MTVKRHGSSGPPTQLHVCWEDGRVPPRLPSQLNWEMTTPSVFLSDGDMALGSPTRQPHTHQAALKCAGQRNSESAAPRDQG